MLGSTYNEELQKHSIISEKEERELINKLKSGDINVRNKLITSNLKLVLKIAHKYKNCGVEFDELVCEGNKGLTTAAMKFNPKMNNKFSTYAYFWIKQAIIESIHRTLQWDARSVNNVMNVETYNDVDLSVDMTEFSQLNEKKTKMVLKLIDGLPKRDCDIVKHYFGLSGFSELNTIEISKKYKMTAMRVSNIIDDSLRKIRCMVLEKI